jgi:hypothetical protein
VKSLVFAPGVGIRAARFERRSSLPVSAACVVASGMRETLAALLGFPIDLRLFEAAIPSPQAWSAIARGALLYRVRGAIADGAIVLRPGDAGVLAAAAFGETFAEGKLDRELSPIERDLLDRVVTAIVGSLAPVCGKREREAIERATEIAGFVTYFEVGLAQPVEARIGIALSRDPAPEPHGSLTLDDLAGVEIPVSALLEAGTLQASEVAALAPGSFVPITRSSLFHGSLEIGGRTIARGSCGVRTGRYAITLK